MRRREGLRGEVGGERGLVRGENGLLYEDEEPVVSRGRR